MKELTKLTLILRSLGITAKVVTDEQITDESGNVISDNIYMECDYGNVHFDVWFEGGFELHFTLNNELVYDTLYLTSLLNVVNEITEKCLTGTK